MDNLVEQVVKVPKNARYYINIVLIILGAVLVPVTCCAIALWFTLPYMVHIGLFLSLFCIYGIWYFVTSLKVDFEYASFSGVFKVDKVIANRRRKKVVKVHLKEVEELFKYDDKKMAQRDFKKVYGVADNNYSDENYVMVFSLTKNNKQAIIFKPNEEMLKSFRPYLSREIARELY